MTLNQLTFNNMWANFLAFFFKAVKLTAKLQPVIYEMGLDFQKWPSLENDDRMLLLMKWDAPAIKAITGEAWEAYQCLNSSLVFVTKLRDDLQWVIRVTSPLPHSKSKVRPSVEKLADLMEGTVTNVAESLEALVGAKMYLDELVSKLPIISDDDSKEAVKWINSIESMMNPVELLLIVEGEEMADVKKLLKKVSS